MPREFNEAIADEADPLDGRVADFDLASVERSMGELSEPLEDAAREQAARFVRALLGFAVEGSPKRRNVERHIGRRIALVAWCLDPGLFDDSPSLRRLAVRIGVSAPALCGITREIAARLGIRNRIQRSHDWKHMKHQPEAGQLHGAAEDGHGEPGGEGGDDGS